MDTKTILPLFFLLQSCTTSKDSTLLGTFIGGSMGATIGSFIQSQDRTEGALAGMAVGAALGGGIGFLDHQNRNSIAAGPQDEGSAQSPTPKLNKPKVKRIWQPAKTIGSRYIDGHYIYEIERQSTWTQPKSPNKD